MITKMLEAVSILPEKPWRGRSAAKEHDPPRKHLVSVLSHRWTTSFVWLINLCICLNYTGSFAVLSRGSFLVIPQKSARLRESGLLDECAPQILRCAQDDKIPRCHPERVSRSPEERRGRICRQLMGNHQLPFSQRRK